MDANGDGGFTYNSGGNDGADTFQYQLTDNGVSSNISTITFNVAQAAPVTVNDTYAASEGVLLTKDGAQGILANDSDINGLGNEVLSPSFLLQNHLKVL